MELRIRTVGLLCCVLAAATSSSFGLVKLDPGAVQITAGLIPGPNDGKSAAKLKCTESFFDDEVDPQYGFLPDGKCVQCGTEESGSSSGKTISPAVTYRMTYRTTINRFCACNIGFYGGQTARTCKPCPTGTTTQGLGATKIKDCNVCAVGFTGSSSKKCDACSKRFEGPVTTDGPGFNKKCVCPKGYTGQPGNCKKCPGESTTARPGAQKCVCPGGGKPPNCKPCGDDGAELDGKCVCRRGLTGKWPNCNTCPNSLGYNTGTLRDGSQQCVCSVWTWEDIVADRRTGACMCNEKAGYHLKVVPNYEWDSEWAEGPCVGPPSRDSDRMKGTKVITVDGKKRLGCDVAKGYGAALTEQLVTPGSDLCIKCNGKGAYIDKKTSRCLCRPPYYVNVGYATSMAGAPRLPAGTTAPAGEAPTKNEYCIKCDAPYLTHAKYWDWSNDRFCRCNWERGYAGEMEDNQLCGKCPSSKPVGGPRGCK